MLGGAVTRISRKKRFPEAAATSFRSPQVILDSDGSSQDDPKDLHRDLLDEDDDSDDDCDDVLLHTRSQRALMSSDSFWWDSYGDQLLSVPESGNVWSALKESFLNLNLRNSSSSPTEDVSSGAGET